MIDTSRPSSLKFRHLKFSPTKASPSKIGRLFGVTALLSVLVLRAAAPLLAAPIAPFRPPAVPLVVFDPYMSIWSEANTLANHTTRYWDGKVQNLVSLIRIDGKTWRVMGGRPKNIPALKQLSVTVFPTRTIYRFANAQIRLRLTFTTPRLPSDLKAMTLPVTYITWRVRSTDGHAHSTQIYFAASSRISVNSSRQHVVGSVPHYSGLVTLKCGSSRQEYFDISGDPVGTDWGYLYTAAPEAHARGTIGRSRPCISDFIATGRVPHINMPRRPVVVGGPNQLVEAVALQMGRVAAAPVRRYVMVAYDEVYSIDYFGQYQRPYWRHIFKSPAKMLRWANTHYATLVNRCRKFDAHVMHDATLAGGVKYSRMAALAYRQSLGAMGISADAHGCPLVFTKEETSNGDIATVDVLFPASPIFLLFNPELEAASMVPVLNSANTPKWKFPWSPHDLGTYPICVGHYRSGGENMPVEESGNMILLAAAIAKAQGNANFAARYWPLFTRWALFLRKLGFDPKNQLSTDDFLGPRPHNSNLSVKAICALGAYGMLCHMRGLDAQGARFTALSRRWAARWMKINDRHGHFRAQFNVPGGWGEPYNMTWDRILGLHLFPAAAEQNELRFLISRARTFGVPLNNKTAGSDTDHSIYTAALARHQKYFAGFINPLYHFLNTSPDRVPFADWYNSETGAAYMHARPVVGALFVPMMLYPGMWHAWASRGAKIPDNFAPLPRASHYTVLLPTAQKKGVPWRYTTHNPGARWYRPGFNDAHWRSGSAGFGTFDPHAVIRTRWATANIWLRRNFEMPARNYRHLCFLCYHDEDVQIYINGRLAGRAVGYTTGYVPIRMLPGGEKALRPGKNLMAVHVHQTVGGQFIDVGIAQMAPTRSH